MEILTKPLVLEVLLFIVLINVPIDAPPSSRRVKNNLVAVYCPAPAVLFNAHCPCPVNGNAILLLNVKSNVAPPKLPSLP